MFYHDLLLDEGQTVAQDLLVEISHHQESLFVFLESEGLHHVRTPDGLPDSLLVSLVRRVDFSLLLIRRVLQDVFWGSGCGFCVYLCI